MFARKEVSLSQRRDHQMHRTIKTSILIKHLTRMQLKQTSKERKLRMGQDKFGFRPRARELIVQKDKEKMKRAFQETLPLTPTFLRNPP